MLKYDVGDTIKYLTIIEKPYNIKDKNGKSRTKVKVKCECGQEKIVNYSNFLRGQSCGCKNNEYLKNWKCPWRKSPLSKNNKKYCFYCKKTKNTKDFLNNKRNKDSFDTICKICKKYKLLKYKYNIDRKLFDKMYKKQNKKCACCKKEFGYKINLDHCHNTNTIRGLLCTACNTGIGNLGDNLDGVLSAFSYLKEFENDVYRSSSTS